MRIGVLVCVAATVAAIAWAQPPEQTGGGRAGRGGQGRGGCGGRGPNFPQQTRPLASPDVLARGKVVFGVNCASCHGADLRGGDEGGPSLLRSLAALSDQHEEVIGPIVRGARQDKGMPAFNFSDDDVAAVGEYIHSVLAKVGVQARPPGAVDPSTLNVLVGNASAGQSFFQAKCASCHSVTEDLKDIASRYSDPRMLQNFDELIATNLKGPHFLTQQAARWMAERGQGRIVFVTSISAYAASVNRAEYCISKAGLSMSVALYAERLAKAGLQVFEIRPGVIRTDMIARVEQVYEARIAGGLLPQARMGEGADVAKAVRAIADGLLDYSTGQVINVDGGFHLRSL